MTPFLALMALTAIDLQNALIVSRSEGMAGTVLAAEFRLPVVKQPVPGKPSIVLDVADMDGVKAEGYRIRVENPSTVHVTGKDTRGLLFGVGHLIRLTGGSLTLPDETSITTSPRYPIRGHQLGYRAQANSYDAWDAKQFERYIRELTYFGVNSIEGIPFHDDRETPVMKTPRRAINRAIGEICARYGLDYWAWIPAEFDLKDTKRRAEELRRCDEFFHDTPQFTGVFFPGGDPGNNPPELVFPYLEDMAKLLVQSHPKAKIWLSLQWFSKEQVDWIYRYIDQKQPSWFAGLVAGPSSPPIPETRARLPKQYKLRSYPDLTHNKLSQYEVPLWDQAFALTLGREAINPRPTEFARIQNLEAAYTDGFISYSDGVHDDVNKTVWSALSWNPDQNVRDILMDYCRAYFHLDAADALLSLERNWNGPLLDNGSVEGTLLEWKQLEARGPKLESNWRWQMCLLRANYDAYLRRRLISETKLENQANAILLASAKTGTAKAMQEAEAILERAVNDPPSPELRERIFELCEKLFQSIGLQTSVSKYFAIGEQRGAVLDFVDRPLNNRWWLEDQFKSVQALPSEAERIRRLIAIAKWEHPGDGSFYDDIGNVANEGHVARPEPTPTYWWWDNGMSRTRLSWQTTGWPTALIYEALDGDRKYLVRQSGFGNPLLRIDGETIPAAREDSEVREFPVDPKFIHNGRLTLNWERPSGEEKLNWRNRARLAEVWLIRQP